MTETPETRCLKILGKLMSYYECHILTNHIRSHIKASDDVLELEKMVREDLAFGPLI